MNTPHIGERTNEPKLIIDRVVFDKVCKCGNRLRIAIQKWDDGEIDAYCKDKEGTEDVSCYMIGNATAECVDCRRRYRSYHYAHTVEARLWKSAFRIPEAA